MQFPRKRRLLRMKGNLFELDPERIYFFHLVLQNRQMSVCRSVLRPFVPNQQWGRWSAMTTIIWWKLMRNSKGKTGRDSSRGWGGRCWPIVSKLWGQTGTRDHKWLAGKEDAVPLSQCRGGRSRWGRWRREERRWREHPFWTGSVWQIDNQERSEDLWVMLSFRLYFREGRGPKDSRTMISLVPFFDHFPCILW